MSFLQKILLFLFTLVLFPTIVFGTHNRAGEITYKHISGFTFEFTITTYTYKLSNANRSSLAVSWGDGTYEEVPINGTPISLPNNYLFNTYTTNHTFPGPGTYQILMEDPNRNLGVKNIPNSVNTIFSIQTTMLIGPFIGTNSTPVLLNPPIDKAAKNHIFIHNPAAYDANGDSISYELTVCTAERGEPIQGYVLPPASDTIYIDDYIGDLTWITPADTGVYNIAMYINEWRDGVKIGRITRDMQIDVYNTDNNPPENSPISDYCVEAGETIEFFVTSTDPDNDPVEQFMVGAPIIDGSAQFDMIEAGMGYTTSKFTWETNCTQARQQPYTLVLKAEDKVTDVSLVDITSFFVRILPGAPRNLNAIPGIDSINLNWDVTDCGTPVGYKVYRRINSYDFIADSCENGLPSYTGYEFIDLVVGASNNNYMDDNKGQGLVPGLDYCYRITALYSDGVESFASEETCATLVPGVPAMLEVSVLSDDNQSGEISVKWAMPRNFDTVDDGPYRYEVYRKTPEETEYSLIETIPTIGLSDTAFLDQNINTLVFPYFYSVKLVYLDETNTWVTYPYSEKASSLYLNLVGTDNTISVEMLKRSPWLNYSYDVFRKLEEETAFDSIASTDSTTYNDTGLANEVSYTYRVRSYSTRPINNIDYNTINISHLNTTMAVDTSAPCAPNPSVLSICDSSYNILSWNSSKFICGDDDIINYQVYYSSTSEGALQLIETLPPSDTTYIHRDNLETLAAIYGVAAVDSFNNVSEINLVTIDSCIMYSLPNVFSPNGDGTNDTYVSWNMGGFVKDVDMSIFNRYGKVVYKTNDPNINWDGTNEDSGQLVSAGVYYYVCEFYEPRLTGKVHRLLKGFIHVFSGDENKQAN